MGGYLTVYPTPADPAIGPPLVSNVNAVAGEHRANLVFVRVGDARRVRVYNPAGRAQVVADVVGYVSPNALGRFLPVTPYRVLDTRYGTGAATIAKIGAREAIDVPVPFAPANATAAVVNVTVTDPTSATWVAAYQGHGAWGGTSSSSSDAGRWSATANSITAQSNSGKTTTYSLEKRNHQKTRDPMLCLDGECYVTYWNKAHW